MARCQLRRTSMGMCSKEGRKLDQEVPIRKLLHATACPLRVSHRRHPFPGSEPARVYSSATNTVPRRLT
jgi:hypothetical protein